MNLADHVPLVQVIIVTWNKKADVLRLLNNLKRIHYPPAAFSTVVVDNASTDGTIEAIAERHPHVRRIRNPRNLGGAGGFNAGMRWALAQSPAQDYLWLLDNDVIVHRDALRELVSVLQARPEAAICGSRIMDVDHPGTLIEAGAFIDYRFGDVRRNTTATPDSSSPDIRVHDVDYVAACSLLARTEAVRRIGVWHDKLFIYWDDMEWGARFAANGYRVLACDASIVYHPSWQERMLDHSAIWRSYYRTRNSLWFFNNYASSRQRNRLLFRMVARYALFSVSSQLRSYSVLSLAFLNGVRDFFANRYGPLVFQSPAADILAHIDRCQVQRICVFVPDLGLEKDVISYLTFLKHQRPRLSFILVGPAREQSLWRKHRTISGFLGYEKNKRGRIPLSHQYRILKYVLQSSWDLMITDTRVARACVLAGKPVARINFEQNHTLAIERLDWIMLARQIMTFCFYLFSILASPPPKERNRRPA